MRNLVRNKFCEEIRQNKNSCANFVKCQNSHLVWNFVKIQISSESTFYTKFCYNTNFIGNFVKIKFFVQNVVNSQFCPWYKFYTEFSKSPNCPQFPFRIPQNFPLSTEFVETSFSLIKYLINFSYIFGVLRVTNSSFRKLPNRKEVGTYF